MSVAVGDKFLTFLLHYTERSGGNVRVDGTSMNPGFFTPTDVTRNDVLQKIVDRRVLKESRFRNLRIALVDLTGPDKLASPQFAGHREREQGGVGSMAKLACMYAAYQLQFDLQALAGRLNITDQKRLFDGIRAAWSFLQLPSTRPPTVIFGANPRIEVKGNLVRIDGSPVPIPRPYSSPDLEEMFTFTGGAVRFIGSDKTKVDMSVPGSVPDFSQEIRDYHDAFGVHGNLASARKLTFAERLFLMIDDSDNPASHTCIENVSFLYIISSIWQADFYRPERGGGLWEGNNQDPVNPFRWRKPPVPRDNPNSDFVSGTTASVASLFTLMAQDRLVSKNASASMRQLTSRMKPSLRNGSFNISFFKQGLDAVSGMRPRAVHAKIGIGAAKDDSALIIRDVGNKQIRYVAVACDEQDKDEANLHDLIVKLDKSIQENNGLFPPSVD